MAIRDDNYVDLRGRRAGSAGDARSVAAQRRDAALERIGSARRWVIMAAAGLSAAFAALVYSLAPGHSLSSARAATPDTGASAAATSAQSGQPALPAPASAAALGVGTAAGSSSAGSGSGSGSSSGSSQSAPAPATSAPAPAPAPVQSSPPVTSGGS